MEEEDNSIMSSMLSAFRSHSSKLYGKIRSIASPSSSKHSSTTNRDRRESVGSYLDISDAVLDGMNVHNAALSSDERRGSVGSCSEVSRDSLHGLKLKRGSKTVVVQASNVQRTDKRMKEIIEHSPNTKKKAKTSPISMSRNESFSFTPESSRKRKEPPSVASRSSRKNTFDTPGSKAAEEGKTKKEHLRIERMTVTKDTPQNNSKGTMVETPRSKRSTISSIKENDLTTPRSKRSTISVREKHLTTRPNEKGERVVGTPQTDNTRKRSKKKATPGSKTSRRTASVVSTPGSKRIRAEKPGSASTTDTMSTNRGRKRTGEREGEDCSSSISSLSSTEQTPKKRQKKRKGDTSSVSSISISSVEEGMDVENRSNHESPHSCSSSSVVLTPRITEVGPAVTRPLATIQESPHSCSSSSVVLKPKITEVGPAVTRTLANISEMDLETVKIPTENLEPCSSSSSSLANASAAVVSGKDDDQMSMECRQRCICKAKLRLNHDFAEAKGIGIQVQADRVSKLIEAAVTNGESSSAVLIGDHGNGKSFLLDMVLREIQQRRHKCFVVRLSGKLLTNDVMALKEITRQLATMEVGSKSRSRMDALNNDFTAGKGSFSQHLAFLLTILREGAHILTGTHQVPVVFILDDFEEFVKRNKQTLLYNLLDLTQSPDSRLVVIGCTTKIDIVNEMEKRVASRFDNCRIMVPQPSIDEMIGILMERLTLPVFAEHEDEATWNLEIKLLLEKDEKLKVFLQQLHALGHSVGFFLQVFKIALSFAQTKTTKKSVLRRRDLEKAANLLQVDTTEMLLCQALSVDELVLVVAMFHLEKVKEMVSYNFELIYHKAKKEYLKGNASKQVARKSFERLLQLNIITKCTTLSNVDALYKGEGRNVNVPQQFAPVRLMIHPEVIENGIRDNKFPICPTDLKNWALNSLTHETTS